LNKIDNFEKNWNELGEESSIFTFSNAKDDEESEKKNSRNKNFVNCIWKIPQQTRSPLVNWLLRLFHVTQ
jgi:hypothetical protein